MNIPQINAGVTERNREQTKRICELLGYEYKDTPVGCPDVLTENATATHPKKKGFVLLEKRSFTLDQVVEMLEAESVVWENKNDHGWVVWLPNENYKVVLGDSNPHDLTAAMDALIKVLEEKK